MPTLTRPRPQGGAGKSPFRYPGGKAFLVPEIQQAILACPTPIVHYAEPFAGGAGAAIELLAANVVEKIHLNDADRRIFAAWTAILSETQRFKEELLSTPLTMDTWKRCREIVEAPENAADSFTLGFATYFLNRTSRSGIIIGSGPIGGYNQAGRWKLDARYYVDTMLTRIDWLGKLASRIRITNLDGADFLRSFRAEKARRTFFFIDPPYVMAGSRLYLNAMNEEKHRGLAEVIFGKPSIENWMMTYDDCPLIRETYDRASITELPVQYSLQKKRVEGEICIKPL